MPKTKADLERELATLQREHENLKETVKRRVKDAMESGEICSSGGNEALKLFGLNDADVWCGNVTVTLAFRDFVAERDERWGGVPDDDYNTFSQKMYEAIGNALNETDFSEFSENLEISVDDVQIDFEEQEY